MKRYITPSFILTGIAVALSALISYYLIQLSEARMHQEIETAKADLRETFMNNLKGKFYGALGAFRDSGQEDSGFASEENHHQHGTITGMDGYSD